MRVDKHLPGSMREPKPPVDDELAKALSAAFGSRSRRKAQLVSRLKQARGYANPVKGGTGKQYRSRRKRFNKVDE